MGGGIVWHGLRLAFWRIEHGTMSTHDLLPCIAEGPAISGALRCQDIADE